MLITLVFLFFFFFVFFFFFFFTGSRYLFGKGAWILPFVFGGIGSALIAGHRKMEVTHLSYGIGLVFIAILGVLAKPALIGASSNRVKRPPPAATSAHASVGFAKPFWDLPHIIGLGALMAAGAMLIIPAPLGTLTASWCHEQAQAIRDRRKRTRGAEEQKPCGQPPLSTQVKSG